MPVAAVSLSSPAISPMTDINEWLKVDALDLEAQGVARNSEGKVVFIEGALPGETVRVKTGRRKNNWEQGELVEVGVPAVGPVGQVVGLAGVGGDRAAGDHAALVPDREGPAFLFSALGIVAAVVLIFGSMYPDVMPAIDPANSLNVDNASSTTYTLTVMTWVAAALVPVVLLYQGWTYWVFKKRITVARIPEPIGLSLQKTDDITSA